VGLKVRSFFLDYDGIYYSMMEKADVTSIFVIDCSLKNLKIWIDDRLNGYCSYIDEGLISFLYREKFKIKL